MGDRKAIAVKGEDVKGIVCVIRGCGAVELRGQGHRRPVRLTRRRQALHHQPVSCGFVKIDHDHRAIRRGGGLQIAADGVTLGRDRRGIDGKADALVSGRLRGCLVFGQDSDHILHLGFSSFGRVATSMSCATLRSLLSKPCVAA